MGLTYAESVGARSYLRAALALTGLVLCGVWLDTVIYAADPDHNPRVIPPAWATTGQAVVGCIGIAIAVFLNVRRLAIVSGRRVWTVHLPFHPAVVTVLAIVWLVLLLIVGSD